MYQKQQGFTLIELMIVVAIIGILAAVAIPAYQDYIARSQVSEAIVLLDGAKTAVEESVSQQGTFPTDTATMTALGVVDSGKYVTSIDSTDNGATDGSGTLTATMRTASVGNAIKGATITMVRNVSGKWSCNPAADAGTITAKFLPAACR